MMSGEMCSFKALSSQAEATVYMREHRYSCRKLLRAVCKKNEDLDSEGQKIRPGKKQNV